MKEQIKILFTTYPLFLWWLPVFFVLHGFRENYDFVPVGDALLLAGIYCAASLVLLLVGRIFFRSWLKAALLAFLLMAFHFFFGAMQDVLRKSFPGSFLTKYIFLLPLFLCLVVAVIIVLKKRKRPLSRLATYLNLLLTLLIGMDMVLLAGKIISIKKRDSLALPAGFVACNDCNNPDIYFIIADEYAGNKELKDLLHFDNSGFLEQLAQRGLHNIGNSSSNYNYTPYSVASMLNMDYLDLDRTGKQPLLAYTYETISNNKFLRFLLARQYEFYNYSFFDIEGHPSQTQETFLPAKTKLITSQTFLSRLNKELRFNLVTRFGSKQELRNIIYANRRNNKRLMELTLATAKAKPGGPKFVLTHLMMPHYPYYFDKQGNEIPFEQLTEGNQENQHNYVEYLQYANKKLLELIDGILQHSPSPPIIVLAGDHGFRHFKEPVERKYYFSNLVSLHLPGNGYSAFSDSITNVNLLRALLNTTFKQQLPYLKDTAFIMENP